MGFSEVRVFGRLDNDVKSVKVSVNKILDYAKKYNLLADIESKLNLLSKPRSRLKILFADKPILMGVVNVTPDSFSDGGLYLNYNAALERTSSLIADGADIIDVGGESTRPGAKPVSTEDELKRILPVVSSLSRKCLVSVDTRKSKVMRECLKVGANIINDVSALTADPESLSAVSKSECLVILMHSKGNPKEMQNNPNYRDVLLDIFDYLSDRIVECEKAGISRDRIIVDPGIGFGQNDKHIKRVSQNISLFHALGCPVLVGFSRKSFIGRWSKSEEPEKRLPGSIAAVLWSASQAVQMFRVHDIAETKQAMSIWSRFQK